jgi:hypothetical protein
LVYGFFVKQTSEDGLKFYRDMGTLKDGYEKYYKNNFFMTEIMNHTNYDEFWQKRSLASSSEKYQSCGNDCWRMV